MNRLLNLFLSLYPIRIVSASAVALVWPASLAPLGLAAGEVLPNGIVLPDVWPPRDRDPLTRKPMAVPYLESPPEVIPIDVGRQLFVDDFLIEKTDLQRRYHHPEKYAGNPIFRAETPRERDNGQRPGVSLHTGGVAYDHREGVFKMWYMAGWYGGSAYAYSRDGLTWTRPDLGFEPGSNHIPDPSPRLRWGMDHVRIDWSAPDEAQRFKSFHYYHANEHGRGGGRVHTSPDGLHWSEPVATGPTSDRNTFFYNPFRKRWIFSLKDVVQPPGLPRWRVRRYREHPDFLQGAAWRQEDTVFWVGADDLDPPDPAIGDLPQLYDLDATAYESLMIGLFMIHRGPANRICEEGGFPKMAELHLGFSRDGFHWHRPDRSAFIPASRRPGDWERAYLHAGGGVALVVGDRLHFYYSGFSGEAPNGPNMYAGGETGVAFLRRDGFASMETTGRPGTLTTRKLRFSGQYLFVNTKALSGGLRTEVLDERGRPIPPYTLENSVAVQGDHTKQRLRWRGGDDLSALAGRPVRLRFHLDRGELYAFWISPSPDGHSRGYVASGGPGFVGPVDSPTGF